MTTLETNQYYEHFRSIPWCAKLMANPEFERKPSLSREPKVNEEDNFFAKTLNTEEAIGAVITYVKRPSSGPAPVISEAWSLFTLGNALTGHPGILHGGVVACLFDEVTGTLLGYNQRLEPPSIKNVSTSTAYLNTTYLKHIKVPQTILVTTTLKWIKGRKQLLDASMFDENGEILAKAEALFVTLKAPL